MSIKPQPNETPFEIVGKYLKHLCSDRSVAKHFLFSRNDLARGTSVSIHCRYISMVLFQFTFYQFQRIVHFTPNYDNGQLLRLLVEIYSGVPESYEVFQGDKNSTREDLKLFLSRASKFR